MPPLLFSAAWSVLSHLMAPTSERSCLVGQGDPRPSVQASGVVGSPAGRSWGWVSVKDGGRLSLRENEADRGRTTRPSSQLEGVGQEPHLIQFGVLQ